MRRSHLVWFGFAVCLAVVLAAMGWISLTAVRLERAEATARARAALEENVRLALWRLDTAVAPILAQETARPYFAYQALVPASRAYGAMVQPNRAGGEAYLASPLLQERPPHVVLHFQFRPDGSLTSPQVPDGTNRQLAVPACATPEAVDEARRALQQLGTRIDRDRLARMLPASRPATGQLVYSPANAPAEQVAQQQRPAQAVPKGKGKGAAEFFRRNEAVSQMAQTANTMLQGGQALLNQPQAELPPVPPLRGTDVRGAVMTPVWIDGQLLLARRVVVDGGESIQGCVLDWPEIRAWLEEMIQDLLPEATLEPAPRPPREEEARMLAALPVRLNPGTLPAEGRAPAAPIRLWLALAWASVLVAAVAVAALLWGVMRLSQRRAAFVSAVTHELRTPLTTFHMYSEMLAEGMVPDGPQRQAYLATLRAEASRLTHLVENVLAYARLERGRPAGNPEELSLQALIDNAADRLAERAAQAGMELVVEHDPSDPSALVRVNRSAVEQILFNLVDNACKYARTASDRRIHLAARRAGPVVELSVRDHGPGIASTVSRRLFRPFSKSAREAAQSAPGVGLGLALSRRLARHLGGRLRHDPHAPNGTRFVLTLPVHRTADRPSDNA